MLKKIPNLLLIRPSNTNAHSLPIFSFIIKNFHCNLVVVLLNDLFGVQSRGGVSCCSVFAQNILHLTESDQESIYKSIAQGNGVPTNYGWCRVSFHYVMTREEIEYILEAIRCVSRYIAKLHQYYVYDPAKNSWQYHTNVWKTILPSQKLYTSEREYSYVDLQNNIKNVTQFLESS